MSAFALTIGGWPWWYLPSDAEVPEVYREGLWRFDVEEDSSLKSHPRLRRALTAHTLTEHPMPRFYGAVHWSDGSDLAALDRKVLAGLASEEDFAGAVFADPRRVKCSTCGSSIHVLAVTPGEPLFSKALPERVRAHEFKSPCPVCGSSLGLEIVEFLGENPVVSVGPGR